jgi:predicted HAD superfamily Cof-like phosphohydrolase
MESVKEFHKAFGCPILENPDLQNYKLRVSLLREEFDELLEAKKKSDIADALGDLLYINYGTYLSLGLKYKKVYRKENGTIQAAQKVIRGCIDTFENYCEFGNVEDAELSLSVMIEWILCLSQLHNINILTVFSLIHKSNMTKACYSIEEVEKTIEKYKDKDPYFILKDNYFVVYSKEGKVLKSVNYKPVDLTFLDF